MAACSTVTHLCCGVINRVVFLLVVPFQCQARVQRLVIAPVSGGRSAIEQMRVRLQKLWDLSDVLHWYFSLGPLHGRGGLPRNAEQPALLTCWHRPPSPSQQDGQQMCQKHVGIVH